jgi:type IV pilus assembly protein PilF
VIDVGAGRMYVFGLIATVAFGCASTGTDNTDDGRTQDQKAAALNAQLGSDYFRQGNWEEAKRKLDKALDQDPRNVEANMVAGLLYDRLGEQSKAESYLQKAVSLDAKNPETRNALAVYLCRHGKYQAGEKEALAASLEPLYKTPWSALYNAGYCARNAGDFARAEQHFRKALEISPRFAPALYEMADLEFRSGEFLTARAFLERHLAAAPASPAALLLGARIEKSLNNRSLAADYARRLRSDYPTSDEVKILAELERTGR